MKAETILEKYFPLVIVSEDGWAQHVVKAMYEFSKHQNKELIEKNDKLKEANSERQLRIEQLIDKIKTNKSEL